MIGGSELSMMTKSQLFYVPPTITERQATHDVLLGPSAATFDEANDITFDIAPCTDLISLADIRFVCDLVIQNADGTKLPPNSVVCPCNNILSTLFHNVQVTLAGRSVSDPSNLYFIRAYLENLLGHTKRAIWSQLSCEGFVLSEHQVTNQSRTLVPAEGNVATHVSFNNVDQYERYNLIKSGNAIQLSGKIHCDLFQQDKPLIPGVALSIKVVRSRVAVGFTAPSTADLPKVCIRNPKLFIRKYVPTSAYFDSMTKEYQRQAIFDFQA